MPESTLLKSRILSGDRESSHAQLVENASRAAAGFSALGVGAEDAVALMLRNDFPVFEASIAANSLGAHAVPINWHFQAEEARYILCDSQAKVLVIHADLLPQIQSAIPEDVRVFVVSTPPEIQTAYAISHQHCRPPRGLPEWSDWLGRQEQLKVSAPPPSSMNLHLGHDGKSQGRATRAVYSRVGGEVRRNGG